MRYDLSAVARALAICEVRALTVIVIFTALLMAVVVEDNLVFCAALNDVWELVKSTDAVVVFTGIGDHDAVIVMLEVIITFVPAPAISLPTSQPLNA